MIGCVVVKLIELLRGLARVFREDYLDDTDTDGYPT